MIPSTNKARKAIVLACWPVEDSALGRLDMDPVLMPLGDRPMLQRVIEAIIGCGRDDILVVLGDRAQACRDLLGDGTRWGCRIQYAYAYADAQPLHILSQHVESADDDILLACAHTLPDAVNRLEPSQLLCWLEAGTIRWSGWARLSGEQLLTQIKSAKTRHALEMHMLAVRWLTRKWSVAPMQTDTAKNVLALLGKLLETGSGPCGILRKPHGPGVWLGNGCFVHPSATLIAPVYVGNYVNIGAGATLGPHVLVGDGCIIDAGSQLRCAYVAPTTYVGASLELVDTLVAGEQLANVRIGSVLRAPDRHFLARVDGPAALPRRTGLAGRAAALGLWLALWPVLRLLRLTGIAPEAVGGGSIGRMDETGMDFEKIATRMCPAHEEVYRGAPLAWLLHLVRAFHPGLLDVAAGRLSLIGLEPRSGPELLALADEWKRLYRKADAGLFNETLLLGAEGAIPAMRYAGDALCTQPQPGRSQPRLLWRYFRLVATDIFQAASQQERAATDEIVKVGHEAGYSRKK